MGIHWYSNVIKTHDGVHQLRIPLSIAHNANTTKAKPKSKPNCVLDGSGNLLLSEKTLEYGTIDDSRFIKFFKFGKKKSHLLTDKEDIDMDQISKEIVAGIELLKKNVSKANHIT